MNNSTKENLSDKIKSWSIAESWGAVEPIKALSLALNKAGYCNPQIILCKPVSQHNTLVAWLACNTAGVIPLFVDGGLPFAQEQLLIQEANARAIIKFHEDRTFSVSESALYDSGRLQAVLPSGGVIHVTSATTGNPKMVFRSEKQLYAEADRYAKQLNISDKDVIISTAPLFHSYGFTSAMLVASKTGASLIDPGMVLPRKILKLCSESNVTVLHGTPLLYDKLIEVSKGYHLGKHIRICISSGGPMPQGLQERFEDTFGIPLLQQYGSTETGSLSISEAGDPYNCIGRPFTGVKFEISPDMNGIEWVHVSSPSTIGSYFSRHGISPLAKQGYKIGDLGCIDSSGRLFLMGRGDDITIIAGKKLSLKMVESVITVHPEIELARCSVHNGGSRKEVHARYISQKEIPPSVLITYCQKHLSAHEIPKKFYRVDRSSLKKEASWKKMLSTNVKE